MFLEEVMKSINGSYVKIKINVIKEISDRRHSAPTIFQQKTISIIIYSQIHFTNFTLLKWTLLAGSSINIQIGQIWKL